ncbi:MAG: hypothetical protein AB8B78_08080 [Polaribacter sp.]
MLFVSCNGDDINQKPSEEIFKSSEFLKKDNRFIELIESNMELANNITDIKKAQSLVKKQSLSKKEINELGIFLGFLNGEEYQKFINNQKKILRDLNLEYDLVSYKDDSLIELAKDAINYKIDKLRNKGLSGCDCNRIRINCLIEVSAAAVLGHLGCASVDWTGIGAPICHGAVLIIQYAAGDNCNANAQACNRGCIT